MKPIQDSLPKPDRVALIEQIERHGIAQLAATWGMSATTLARVAVGSGCNHMTRLAVRAALAAVK